MKTEAQKKLEDIVARLYEPEEIVMEKKEIIEKLEKVLSLMNNPDEVVMEKKEIIEKLERIVLLVNNTMIDIDVDVEYCIPEVETSAESCNISGKPYILLTYVVDGSKRTRKVSLGKTALQSTPEDLSKHVILAIEEFKDEIDDIQMG